MYNFVVVLTQARSFCLRDLEPGIGGEDDRFSEMMRNDVHYRPAIFGAASRSKEFPAFGASVTQFQNNVFRWRVTCSHDRAGIDMQLETH